MEQLRDGVARAVEDGDSGTGGGSWTGVLFGVVSPDGTAVQGCVVFEVAFVDGVCSIPYNTELWEVERQRANDTGMHALSQPPVGQLYSLGELEKI